jgi:hypothetical protein
MASFIDNQVEPTTSTFLVRAEVPNPEGSILPGQYIKATMTVGHYVNAIAVPERSVVLGQEGTRVFVVDAENKVQEVKVTAVDVVRGLRVLESGLKPGQKVIVEGIQLVRPGQAVEPVISPLENYILAEAAQEITDPRFNSRISRIPGMDSGAGKAAPGDGKPVREPRGSRSPSPRPPIDSEDQDKPRSASPPATKAR